MSFTLSVNEIGISGSMGTLGKISLVPAICSAGQRLFKMTTNIVETNEFAVYSAITNNLYYGYIYS